MTPRQPYKILPPSSPSGRWRSSSLLCSPPATGHGYGLRQDILEHTGGRIELRPGVSTGISAGWRMPKLLAEADTPANEDERRIYYRLTPFGRKVLAAEMLRLRALVRLAEARRVISPARS